MEDSIRRYKETVFFNPALNLKSPAHYHTTYTGSGKRVVHIVKQGETLGQLAMRYHVSVNQIKDWNGFNSNVIRTGQKLVIYVPARHAAAVTQSTGSTTKPAVTTNGGNQYYTVREGDTIWGIAKKFPGTSPDDILRLNNLSVSDKISVGQRLIIATNK